MLGKIIIKYKNLPVQVKASFWFLSCAFLQKGISVITTPVFTRLLSTEEYGNYSVWSSWLGIVTVFVSLNLYYGVYTSGLVRYDNDRKNFVVSLESLNFLSCAIWLLFYLLTRRFWNGIIGITTNQIVAMLLIIWTTSIFNFWSAEQRVEFKYKSLVVLTLIMAVAKPVLGIILIKTSTDKVLARIYSLCAVELLLCIPILIKQIQDYHTIFNTKYWKYALAFNIPLIPHYLSQVVLNSSDRIMIGKMVGSAEAGVYNLAYSISLIMTMFNTALMQTIEPWMYKKLKEDRAKDITIIAYGLFVFVALLNLLLILFAPELVSIFAPKTYQDATWLIPPIAMSVYFMFQYTFFAVVEFYYKKTKYISIATIIGALINLVSNYIFIKICGYHAAAYTTLGCYILYTIFHFIFMKKLCNENLGYEIYNTSLIFWSSLMFLGLGFACMTLYGNSVLRYMVIISAVFLIIVFNKKIINFIRTMLGARKEVNNG